MQQRDDGGAACRKVAHSVSPVQGAGAGLQLLYGLAAEIEDRRGSPTESPAGGQTGPRRRGSGRGWRAGAFPAVTASLPAGPVLAHLPSHRHGVCVSGRSRRHALSSCHCFGAPRRWLAWPPSCVGAWAGHVIEPFSVYDAPRWLLPPSLISPPSAALTCMTRGGNLVGGTWSTGREGWKQGRAACMRWDRFPRESFIRAHEQQPRDVRLTGRSMHADLACCG